MCSKGTGLKRCRFTGLRTGLGILTVTTGSSRGESQQGDNGRLSRHVCPRVRVEGDVVLKGSRNRGVFPRAYGANIRTDCMILLSKDIMDNRFVQ